MFQRVLRVCSVSKRQSRWSSLSESPLLSGVRLVFSLSHYLVVLPLALC